MIKFKVSCYFELTLYFPVTRNSRWSYCWHKYSSSSCGTVVGSSYLCGILQKEEGEGSNIAVGISTTLSTNSSWYFSHYPCPLFMTEEFSMN
jgi:hypothetical protein